MRLLGFGSLAAALVMCVAAVPEQRPPDPQIRNDVQQISVAATMESVDLSVPDTAVMAVQVIAPVGVVEVGMPLERRSTMRWSRSPEATGHPPTSMNLLTSELRNRSSRHAGATPNRLALRT